MCGLFGCYSPHTLSKEARANVVTLGNLSKSRGTDSTGIFTCERARKKKGKKYISRLRKDTINATDFFDEDRTVELVEDEPFIIAGHTRMATHGAVNTKNAHPFNTGHILGMHNGVIRDLYDKINDKTDSLVLLEMINTAGIKKTFEYVNNKTNGDMALCYLNKSNNTLNLCTNGGRSLYYGKIDNTWYWASEKKFLQFISKKWDWIEEVQPSILYSMKLEDKKWRVSSLPKVVKHTTYSPSYDTSGLSTTSNLCAYEPRKLTGIYQRTFKPVGLPDLKGTTEIGPVRERVKFQALPNLFYNIEQLRPILKQGCSCCTKPVGNVITNRVWFWARDKFICEDCHDNDEMISAFWDKDELHKGEWILPNGRKFVGRSKD